MKLIYKKIESQNILWKHCLENLKQPGSKRNKLEQTKTSHR